MSCTPDVPKHHWMPPRLYLRSTTWKRMITVRGYNWLFILESFRVTFSTICVSSVLNWVTFSLWCGACIAWLLIFSNQLTLPLEKSTWGYFRSFLGVRGFLGHHWQHWDHLAIYWVTRKILVNTLSPICGRVHFGSVHKYICIYTCITMVYKPNLFKWETHLKG